MDTLTEKTSNGISNRKQLTKQLKSVLVPARQLLPSIALVPSQITF